MARLQDKVVVIIGGAGGIGLSSASAAVREGAVVVVGDVRDPEHGFPPAALFDEVDATDGNQVDRLVTSVVQRHGRVDVLMNNAGIAMPGSVLDVDPEAFDRVFQVNVKSVYHAVRAVLPHMLERSAGSIVNTASNGGLIGRPGDPVYNASKHAVVGLTKSLALAYADVGLRVNALCPGAVDTPMLRSLLPPGSDYDEMRPHLAMTSPIPRVARPEEIADAFVFLASDESRYITGVALPIDGGKAAGVMPAHRYRTDFPLLSE